MGRVTRNPKGLALEFDQIVPKARGNNGEGQMLFPFCHDKFGELFERTCSEHKAYFMDPQLR